MSKFKDAMASVSIFDGSLSRTAFKALDSALDLSGGHINVAHYLPKERLKHIHSDLECARKSRLAACKTLASLKWACFLNFPSIFPSSSLPYAHGARFAATSPYGFRGVAP